jgi:IclR family transcriptional regulator, acetate operon repressor
MTAFRPSENARPVKSADRVLDIFEALCDEPDGLALSELAGRLEIAHSSVHALLHTLSARGYLRREGATKRYALGPRLIHLSLGVSDGLDLRSIARDALENLVRESQETAFVAQLDGRELIYVDRVVSSHRAFRTDPRLSARVPLHCSALGKAILAALAPKRVEELLGADVLVPSTPFSITDRAELERNVAEIRERGYAIDDQESMLGVRCAGAPIRDRSGEVIAAVSVVTIVALFDGGLLGPAVANTAVDISCALGWQGSRATLFSATEKAT